MRQKIGRRKVLGLLGEKSEYASKPSESIPSSFGWGTGFRIVSAAFASTLVPEKSVKAATVAEKKMFHYLSVTTGWIFYISLCDNSINQ